MGANQNNVNKILERAGAATAASAVPVSGASNINSANTQRGANPNRVSDILTRAGANQNRVSDILTRAGAKPVEPEWQAAMFGGTPRWILSDEKYRGIIDVDEMTGKQSLNANAAQTAREQFLNYNNLMTGAANEMQRNQFRESRDWYGSVLDELGVQDRDVLNVQLDERRNALNAAQAEYDNVMLQYGIDQSGASNDILNAARAKLSQAEMDYNKVLGKDRERAMGEFTGGLQTDISNVAGLLKIADTTRRESDLSKKELLEQRRGVNAQLDQIRASLRAEGKTEEEIESLFNYYRQMNSAEERKTAEEEARAAAENRSDFGNWFANTALGITSGVGAVDIGVQKIVNDIRGKDAITGQDRVVDYNSAWQSPYYISEAIMQGEMDKITKENGGTEWADSRAGFIRANGYQLAVSMGQSAAVAGLSAMGVPAATLLLGGSAATSTMQEFHDLGYSDAQAIAMGVSAGFAEYITEKYSLESLMSMRSVNGLKGKEAVKVVLGNIFRQTLTEGSEEMASDFVNLAADCLINGDMSKNKMRIQELVAQGMDPEEARKQVEREWLSQLMQDGIMGAISGGLFGGGGMAINAAATNAGYNAAGKTIITEQTQKTLQNKIAGLDDTIAKAVRADAEIDTESRKSLGRAADALGRSELVAAVQEQLQAAGEEASPELISGILAMARNERLLAEEKNAVRQSENAKAIAEQLGEAMQEKFSADNAWAQRPVYAAMMASSGMIDGIPAPEVDLGPSLNYDGIPAPRVALAGEEIGPDTRPLTMNSAPAGAEAMNEGGIQNGNQMGNDSAERMDLQRAGGEGGENAGGMAEAAGADQRGKTEERRVRALDLPEQGSRDLIEIGTDSPKIKVLPETMWDDELREAYAQAEAKGLEMIPVVGELEGYDHGKIVTGNAVIVGNRIIVQADNADWGVMQLIEHEIGHSEENEELNAQTRKEILDRYSEEEFTEIFNTYKAMLPGYTEEEILSEIIQNARAGMNAFGKDVTQYRETVRETYDRARDSAGQEQENGTREIRGPTEWSRGEGDYTAFLEEYNPEDVESIKKEGKKYRNLVLGEEYKSISDFYKKWKAGRDISAGEKLEKLYIGKVTDNAKTVLSGIFGHEVNSPDYIIDADEIRHIEKEHGSAKEEIDRGNIPLSDDVLNMLPEVISKPDSIEPGETRAGEKAAVFKKKISGGTIIYVQIDETGRLVLKGKSLYIKKESKNTTATDADKSTSESTSETTGPSSLSKNNIAGNSEESKGFTEEKSVDFSRSGMTEEEYAETAAAAEREETVSPERAAEKTAEQIALEKAVEAAGGKITWSRGGENLLTEEGPEETASNTEMPTSTTEMPTSITETPTSTTETPTSTTETPTSITETPEAKQQQTEAKAAMYEAADALAESGTEEETPEEEPAPKKLSWGQKFAESLFGVDSEAQAEAEAMEKAVKTGNEVLDRLADDFENPMDLYESQQKVTAEVKESDVKDKMSARVEKEQKSLKERVYDSWHKFIRSMVNEADAVHEVAKATGDKSKDGYYFFAKAASQRAAQWTTGQRMSLLGDQTGKGLNAIFDPIRAKGDDYYNDFQTYLYSLLDVDRQSRDFSTELADAQMKVNEMQRNAEWLSTMSEAKLRRNAKLYEAEAGTGTLDNEENYKLMHDYWMAVRERDRLEAKDIKPVFGYDHSIDKSRMDAMDLEAAHTEFKEMAEEVYAYSRDLLQYRVDAGLISQEDMDNLTEIYPHYIPVAYNMSKEEEAEAIRKGNIQVSTTIGKAQGGDAKLLPLHYALARQTLSVMKNAGFQQLGNSIYQEYKTNKAAVEKFILKAEETDAVWDEDIADNDDIILPKENVITIFNKEGKRIDLTLSDEMAQAFMSLQGDKLGRFDSEFMMKLNNGFKALCTSMNPVFVATNAIKDVQEAAFYSTDTKKWMKNYPKTIAQILHGGQYWQMYKNMGGLYNSYFDFATGEKTERKSKFMRKVEGLNMTVEQMPRLAEFMTVLQNAEADHGTLTMDDYMEAFNAAAEVTTNFSRGGTIGKWVNRNLVPFWNPGVQGLSKVVRTAAETTQGLGKTVKTAAASKQGLGKTVQAVAQTKEFKAWGSLIIKCAALGILPEIVNGLFYRDDDEWDVLDDDMKVNYYLIKGKDGQWIKIPKGRVLAALSTPTVGLMEEMRGDDVDWWQLGKTAASAIAPNNPFETNILSTAMQARLSEKDNPGKTWYGGDIESKRLQNYAPGERYDESTDYISKWIGGKLNLSPKKINYIIDQYSGVIGDLLLPMLTPRAEEGLYIGNFREPLLSMFVSRFTTDTVRSNDISDGYYDLLDQLGYAAKAGDDNAKIAEKFMNAAGSEISDLYAQIREIENDTELTGKEKTELTRELRKQLNTLQKDITEEAERYLDAAGDFLDERPDLDYTDEANVQAWMEAYNAEQTAPTARLTAEQAQKKMEAEVYRELNRQQFGAEYALEKYNGDVYDKAQELAEESGIDYEAFYDYYFGKSALRDDKDAQGRTISGTKMEKVVELIDGLDIPDEQKDALYYDAGYSDSKIYNTPWHGGDGSFAKANKDWEVAEDDEKRDAWVQSYLTSRPEIDYTDTATVRAWMEQYNAEQSSDEYWTDLAGAASKMRAEVEREANKAMYGADYALHRYSEDVWEKAQGLNVNYQLAYEDYYDFYFQSLKCYSDKDENGKSISGSKKAKIVDLIDSMAVTDDQKDGLFLAAGYTESGLKGTPWHGGKSSSGRRGGGGRRNSGKSTGKKLTDSISTKAAGKTGGDGWGLTEDGRIWIEPPQIGDFDMSAMQKAQEIVDKYDDNDIWAALWSHYAKPTTETGFRL